MESVIAQPGRVRRVACQALVENERGQRWLEPMVHLSVGDLQELMNDGSQSHMMNELYYGVNIVNDTSLTAETGGQARRTLLASDWLATLPSIKYKNNLWSHLLVVETPPREFGFDEYEG